MLPAAPVVLGLCLWLAAAATRGETASEEIERKRLDFHPLPTLVREAVRLDGQIDVGLRRAVGSNDGWGVGQTGTNWLRLSGIEPLDGGWYAAFALEHAFEPGTGSTEGAFWGRSSGVSLGHRHWGRLTLGRTTQPVVSIAALADPLSGGVAEVDDWLVRRKGAKDERPSRSADAITWRLPELWPGLAVELQSSDLDDGARASHGLAATYVTQGWRLGLGWQAWAGQRSNALPIVARRIFGDLDTWAALTLGRLDGNGYRTLSVGATWRPIRGPRPAATTLQLTQIGEDGRPGQWRLGLGREMPLSPRTALHAAAVVEWRDGAASRVGAEFGVRYRFNL